MSRFRSYRRRCARESRAILAIALACLATAALAQPRPIPFRTQTMGTWATLTLVAEDSAAVADLALDALLCLHHTDSLMTNWTATSEVARLNRVAGRGATPTDPEVFHVLSTAQAVSAASGGAFDITVEPLVRLWGFLGGEPRVPDPDAIEELQASIGWQLVELDAEAATVAFDSPDLRIDLGGVAKGHGVDRVAGILKKRGVTDALIDLSGNMVALGASPGRDGWLLGIRDPRDREPYLATILLKNEAVATSGAYARFVAEGGKTYGHILDPRTGWPAEGLTSATVVARSAAVADAWATAFFVLGPAEARRVAAARDDLHVVLLEPVGEDRAILWVERALAPRLNLAPAFADRIEISVF